MMYMNIQEMDIMKTLLSEPFLNQRILAEQSGHSVGVVNRSLRTLVQEGYLDEQMHLTDSAKAMVKENRPKHAVILAAGYGMRMVPINHETPKGLLTVNGEPLIERLIKQLHEVDIYDITVVVGFMKEYYEYLIDEYQVELVVNPEYSTKNNLHSMKLVSDRLDHTYVMPCDIWCASNPFSTHEFYSWYMVSDLVDDDSTVRVNRKMELTLVPAMNGGNAMIGIAYLQGEAADRVRDNILSLSSNGRNDNVFWEEALYDKGRMFVMAKVVHAESVVEIDTYEQLRDLDHHSTQLKSGALEIAAEALGVSVDEITDIAVLKKGMTNRSFLFCCGEKKYIMRIPGEGTDKLINRANEASVYRQIAGQGICDDVIYINPENGYKITAYLEGARVCDASCERDLELCMEKLRLFHARKLQVSHSFDLFGQIDFYESLWNGAPSCYKDYRKTKQAVLSLRDYIEEHAKERVLTHIDAVPDNFLFTVDQDGNEDIRLIDWEYSGMQDPHVDLAMFCIYALYDREEIDRLIDIYFEGRCSHEIRVKIYCYIAVCGLLWSNWCEYKRSLGVDFGEYSLRQYRYAKDYYRIVQKELEK